MDPLGSTIQKLWIHLAWRSILEATKKLNPLVVQSLKYGIWHLIQSLLCPQGLIST